MKAAIVALAIAMFGGTALAACGDDEDSGGGSSAAAGSGIDKDKPPARFTLISIKIPGVALLDYHKAGAEAAARKINAAGGFGGRETVIETCNTQLQPAVATTCAHKTLRKDPIAQFGCEVSWGQSGLKLYANAKVPSFNCVNSPEDFTNPWSFGLSASAFGAFRGAARLGCQRSDIKKVVVFTQDIPQQRKDAPAAVDPVLKQCGKPVSYVYYPLTGSDLTPYINKAAQQKPDFVITLVGEALILPMFKGFQQAGIPPSKIVVPDSATDYRNVLSKSGSAMEGAYISTQFRMWGQPDKPGVEEYLAAMKGADVDARNSSAVWGYQSVMWFYEVAKKIGFDRFDSESLAEFMRTQNGVDMVLSRKLTNPGPKGFPQVKQPYIQMTRWQNGKIVPVQEGTDDGWILGF